MRLYVASSWRNPYQQNLVAMLRQAGQVVYDFQHPPGGDHLGFSWSDVDPEWRRWSVAGYLEALEHPTATAGFESDYGAMQRAQGGVLVLPAGASAHIETGWLLGAGKPVWILLDEAAFPPPEGHSNPELMYRMAGVANLVADVESLLEAIAAHVFEPGVCSVCGCTDDQACDDGCWWADEDETLCSSCVEEAAA